MAAARKRKKIRSGPASPSTGLVVFLVFFILLSLGLGGWAFSIMKKIDERDKKIKDMETTAQKDDKLKKWYRLQTLWAKSVAGEPLTVVEGQTNEPNELITLMGQYEQDFFKDDMPDYKAFQGMLAKDLENLGGKKNDKTKQYENWDDANKKLKTSYQSQWAALKKENGDRADEYAKMKAERDTLVKNEADRKKKQEEDWGNLNKAIVATNTELETQKGKYEKEVKKTIEELQNAGKGMEETVEKIRKDNKALTDEQARKLKDKDEEIAKLRINEAKFKEKARDVKAVQVDVLSRDRPKGKVVRVDFTGKMPYINLGSADGAKEELTFSIYGRSANGKIDKEPKGSLEIARVIGPNLSQARIIDLADSAANPIQEGDVVFNPAWDPSRKTHVAIAGLVDLNSSGSLTLADEVRDLREFINNLEKQNIIVDAYLDLRELKVKGPGLALTTDYLIVGKGPNYEGVRILDTKDEKMNMKSKTEDMIKAMREEAVKKGVAIIPLHKFLVLTGYRVPRAIRGAENLGGGYDQPAAAPEKKPEKKKDEERLGEKKEDKDKEDMKKKEDKDDKP